MNLAIRLLLLNLPLLGAQSPDPAALVRAVAAYEYGQDRAPLDAVSDLTRASHADPALRARLESALIGLLRGHATNAAKDFACRELSVIGGDASVPALAALLDDAALGAFAIYALERIPGKESAGALAKALPGSSGMTRLGLINALARRGVPNPLFRQWLASGDAQVAAAAAAALGAAGDRSDLQRLLDARASNPAAQEAVLRLAERLGPGGRSVYQALYRPGEPLMARVAALEGLARLDGARALPSILEALQSPEPALQREAVRLAARHGGRTQLLAALPSQPPSLQVVTLTALSEAGAAEALPAFRAAASSAEPAVRIAAIRALARHGGAKEAALLARIAAESEEAERDEARSALARLRGAPVDAAIVQSISSSEGKVKVELIRAAGERGVAEAAPSLLAAARSADRDVRRESYRALREIAPAASVPDLAALLSAAPTAADRREMERTLAATLRRNLQAPLAPVEKELSAAKTVEARASLLTVLGQSAREDALPRLRAALSDSDAAVRRAAVLALTEWPDAGPAADLLETAKSDAEQAIRILALRGYIRLVSAPSQRPPAEVARELAEALKASPQPEEKKAVLAALTGFVCPESLEIARSLLADPSVAPEAKSAVQRLERSLTFRR